MLIELYNSFVHFVPAMAAWHMAGGTALNNRDISNYVLGLLIEKLEK